MELDVERLFGVVTREVAEEEREGRMARAVIASRVYDTTVEDLWDAVTNKERIPRWFSPVSGELRLGGTYQIEGNASGTITACRPLEHFASTWEFGGGVSWIEVDLLPQSDGRTLLQLKHIAHVDDHWKLFGPGAVGVGWDLSVLGLGLHLETGEAFDPAEAEAWTISENGKQFVRLCSAAWGEAAIAAGEDPAQAQAAAENTTKFYTGELEFPMPES